MLANSVFEGNLELRGTHGSMGGPEPMNTAHTRWQIRLAVKDAKRQWITVKMVNGTERMDWIYPAGARYSTHERTVKGPDGFMYSVPMRGIGYACWHAHGRFMRHLLEQSPDGKIVTTVGTWHGLGHFMQNMLEKRGQNRFPAPYRCPVRANLSSCLCSAMGRERWDFRS